MGFWDIYNSKAKEVDAVISKFLLPPGGENALLKEAMIYAACSGGKRLRPILLKEVSELFPVSKDRVEDFMAAIEFIHSYSLVHDDLPDMDNDLLRRGKPTTHAKYGPAQAILAGDALLNRAYEVMTAACVDSAFPHWALRAMKVIADAAGADGMVGGQSVDMIKEGAGDAQMGDLVYIHENKTARLLAASTEAGVALCGGDSGAMAACRALGRHIGIAFQITDDILNVEGDEARLGKPTGSDAQNEKVTIVSLLGLDEAKRLAQVHTDQSIEILMSLPGDKTFLHDLITELARRDH